MLYALLGILGFISFLVFDILSLRKQVLGKYLFLLLGIGLIVYSSIHIAILHESLIIPQPIRLISLSLAALFTLLLIYSVFIEVGFNTYEANAHPHLVTNGTYSLVRHPGVIWLFTAYVFWALFYANMVLLITAFVWTICNTLYIILQERLILKKLFEGYDNYSKSTPMIIPTFSSMRRFMTLQNWRKE